MNVETEKSGPVVQITEVDSEITLREEFYPLCADSVQTNIVFDEDKVASVRPDSYAKPVYYSDKSSES